MARFLSFTRAAEECNVTQPSLTRAIQKLEDELSGVLFRRERSRTHLTDLGRLMLPHLEQIFEAAEAAKELARNVGNAVVAPLALGIDASLETDTLDGILGELGMSLPGLELTLTTGTSEELLEAAKNGDLDLLIVELPDAPPERLDRWSLYTHVYHMVVRADHPLAMKPPTSLGAARDETWIDHDGGSCTRLRAAAAELGFEPMVRHRASDLAQVKRLVVAGLGSAFIPKPRDDTRIRSIRFADAEILGEVVLGAVAGRKRSFVADAFVRASRARSWSSASEDLALSLP